MKGLFGVKFDLIFANQSLYYLPQKALRQNIDELFELSNEGAIIFATMMSEKNYYFKFAGAENEEGLREVRLKGRLNETSFIHFTKEAKELEALFKPFETLYLGEYEPFYLYDFEGSAQHFIYIGVKR